jgi:hypothetical protein
LGGVKSWWAKNISQRAAEIGLSEERYYRTAYFHYCRYVHSGPGGAGSANAQEVFHACGFAHLATQERFLKALDRICRKFHLYEANAKLGNIPCRIQEAVGFAGDYSKENLWRLQEELAKWGPTGQAPQ